MENDLENAAFRTIMLDIGMFAVANVTYKIKGTRLYAFLHGNWVAGQADGLSDTVSVSFDIEENTGEWTVSKILDHIWEETSHEEPLQSVAAAVALCNHRLQLPQAQKWHVCQEFEKFKFCNDDDTITIEFRDGNVPEFCERLEATESASAMRAVLTAFAEN